MGAAPSREVDTIYSYFRGTYEIGLIPLTKKFFGHPTLGNNSDDTPTAEQLSTAELRRQFVLMRRDPAIVYGNSREKVVTSWAELLCNPFTEEDLDTFLDLVDKDLYDTDSEMIADTERAILPVPCALCLACKDGQERPGCFLWRGRSIVVIGYFSCITSDLRKAFRISKGKHSITSSDVSNNNIPTDDTGDRIPSLNFAEAGGVRLFMNAAVLASAGDRTMERVLVLAAVMLRNQYLEAAFRVAGSLQSTSENPTTAGYLNINNLSDKMYVIPTPASHSMPMSESQVRAINTPFSQVREDALRTLEQRLLHLTICVESAFDNYSSLKSLTENVAFIQCQIKVDPTLCIVGLPDNILAAYSDMESDGKVNREHQEYLVNGLDNEEEHKPFAEAHLSQPVSVNQAVRFGGEVVDKENTKNDGSSASCVDLPPIITYTDDAKTTCIEGNTAATDETSNGILQDHLVTGKVNSFFHPLKKTDGEQERLPAGEDIELVKAQFEPMYVAKATLWASSLLTVPLRIAGGSWVQYKLKDESEELRQTLHGKDLIVARWREDNALMASSYMGEKTTILLRYVRALQEEVEHARTLPPNFWTEDQLVCTREGRTCALYHNPRGTMLIGIRNRSESEEVKKKAKKERASKEDICPCAENENSALFNNVRSGISLSNTVKSNMSCSEPNISPPLVAVPEGLYQPRAGPAAFFPVANNFMAPPLPIPPPPPFPFFQSSSTSVSSMGVSSAPTLIPTFTGANEEGAKGNRANPGAVPMYFPPPSFTLASTATSTGLPMQTVYNGLNGTRENDSACSVPPPPPMQPGATMQAMPFSYPIVSQFSSPAHAFIPAAPLVNPVQQLQQQQQFVFMQQATGHGGVPLLVPMTVAPQQPSFMPPYGYPMGAGMNQSVLMPGVPSAAQQVRALPPQSGIWNPPMSNGGVMGNGQPNYVYYFPSQ